jgi:Na+/proline symporter
MVKRIGTVVVLAFALWALLAPPAYAYVDPGTGSFVFQLIIGGALAVAVSVKLFWRRIVGIFTRRPAEPDE